MDNVTTEISGIFFHRYMSTICRKCSGCNCPIELNRDDKHFIYCPRCGKLSSDKDNITWGEADNLRKDFGLICKE